MRVRRIVAAIFIYYVACCVVLAICLAEMAFHPGRRPITERQSFQSVAARFGAALQDVSLTASDGTALEGWFARPSTENGDAVILLHGIGDNRKGMTVFAEIFLSKGYSVLLPDLRAQGTSGGNFPTYGIKEADDVQHWFRWSITRQHSNCVFGMGESMGAAIVLQAAAITPFCAVVAESPFASFRQIAYVRVGQMFHTGSWLGSVVLRPAVELAFLYGKLTRGVNLARVSPQDAVAQTSVPVFLIHGLADDNIPAQQSEMIHARNPGNVTLWEVPNAGHCGAVDAAPEEFNIRVLGWFASHNCARNSCQGVPGSVSVVARP